jgi:hypothetical protein
MVIDCHFRIMLDEDYGPQYLYPHPAVVDLRRGYNPNLISYQCLLLSK